MLAFPIIVGCARSGTTLLRSMLHSHPELAVVDNTGMLIDLSLHDRRYGPTGQFCLDGYLADIGRNPGLARLEVTLDELTTVLRDRPPRSLRDAVRKTFALYATRQEKPHAGEKAPEYVLHLRRVGALLPEARFLHVVRDGRDVALALRDSQFGTNRLVPAAVQWEARVVRGRRAGEALGRRRYLEVSYERLVADAEATLRSVCDFLEISYEPAMLEYHRHFDRDWRTPQSVASHSSLALPPTPGLRDWRNDMTPEQASVFEMVAGRTLRSTGYPLADGRVADGRVAIARRVATRSEEVVFRARQTLELGARLRRARRLAAGRRAVLRGHGVPRTSYP